MLIELEVKYNYGNMAIYVKDAKLASILSKLTGTRTLQLYHIEALKELGFVFVETLPERKW